MSTNVNWTNFSAEQLRFMIWLSDADAQGTQKELAEQMGVCEETLCRWKRQADFRTALWELAYSNLTAESGRVSASLLRQAKQGDARCLRLYFELMGKIGPHRPSLAVPNGNDPASMQEVVNGLRSSLTKDQLEDYLQRVSNYYGIGRPGRTNIQVIDSDIRIEENVQLEIVAF